MGPGIGNERKEGRKQERNGINILCDGRKWK